MTKRKKPSPTITRKQERALFIDTIKCMLLLTDDVRRLRHALTTVQRTSKVPPALNRRITALLDETFADPIDRMKSL